MIEIQRVFAILRVKKIAEATAAGHVGLIPGSQRTGRAAHTIRIAPEEVRLLEIVLRPARTKFIWGLNPRLWAPDFLDRNAEATEAFLRAHSAELRELCARVGEHCRVALCTCFVCGYPGLARPMYERTNRPSKEPCPSCGFVFGIDDKNAGRAYERRREEWLVGGPIWQIGDAPVHWDGHAQLAVFLERRSSR